MSGTISERQGGIAWEYEHQTIWVVAWGKNGVRVRATEQAHFKDLPQALLDNQAAEDKVEVTLDDSAVLRNGDIEVEIDTSGNLTFYSAGTRTVLLKEWVKNTNEHKGRNITPFGSHWKLEQRYYTDEDEKLYGLGQHQHGFLNQKGCTIELLQRNMEVNIPFLVSSRGYGYLWNHPGTGRADLGRNEIRWTADSAQQLDYYVVAGETPAEILERYAEVTGKPTAFPPWASGFWQCKLRYRTQKELMDVAREYSKREIPISVIIIDFHHWTQQGDWKFDPEAWPDPKAMVEELSDMGIELMVSVWPTVSLTSENFEHMNSRGLLLRSDRGRPIMNTSSESVGSEMQGFYDSTNPEAREFIMDRIRKNYCTHGVKLFWLDTMEPEIIPLEQDNTRYHIGHGNEVSSLYPLMHQKAFYEGLRAEGETEILTLGRSAWAGSQRYGAALWSADVPSTFDSLRRQVTGGLNAGMSGIPWWTSDIGGFYGLTIEEPEGRELLVRWFEFGIFCPICRLHGVRRTRTPVEGVNPPNEVWSYGDEVYEILCSLLDIREQLRPYIHEQMKVSERTGAPLMRPLFFDYPSDDVSWEVEDQYMFGPEILVAPITAPRTFQRTVYLPDGSGWRHWWSGERYEGGRVIEIEAPLNQIPFFLTDDSALDIVRVEPKPSA